MVPHIPLTTTMLLSYDWDDHLFLQQSQGAGSIEIFRALNNDNCFDFGFQSIDEAHGKVHRVRVLGVGCELVFELTKLSDIGRNSGGLADIEQLAEQQLMLIPVEPVMKKLAEGLP